MLKFLNDLNILAFEFDLKFKICYLKFSKKYARGQTDIAFYRLIIILVYQNKNPLSTSHLKLK